MTKTALALLLLSSSVRAASIIRSVCPSGCDFTSVAAAAAASGRDDAIEFSGDDAVPQTHTYQITFVLRAWPGKTGLVRIPSI